MSKGSKTGKKK